MKPQLSIIIPVINEAEQIAKRLQALQPLRDRCQLLMVDGGSSDGSGMLAVSLVDHVLTSPRGRARQMNVGAERTQADILLFLQSTLICRIMRLI